MTKIGAMRRRIQLLELQETPDGQGGYTSNWVTFATVWGDIEPDLVKSNDIIIGQQLTSKVTYIVTIRYRPGVLAAMRVQYEGRIYRIDAVIDPGLTHTWLQLRCWEEEK